MDRDDFQHFIIAKTGLAKNTIRHTLSRVFIYLDWLEKNKRTLNKASMEELDKSKYRLESENFRLKKELKSIKQKGS